MLADAIKRAESAIGGDAIGSIPLPAQEQHPPMIVHVLPIRGEAQDTLASAAAMVVVTRVVPSEVPTAEVIQGLFELTPYEARIAQLIGAGSQPRAAAAQLSEGAARTALKHIFGKTGVRRQAETRSETQAACWLRFVPGVAVNGA